MAVLNSNSISELRQGFDDLTERLAGVPEEGDGEDSETTAERKNADEALWRTGSDIQDLAINEVVNAPKDEKDHAKQSKLTNDAIVRVLEEGAGIPDVIDQLSFNLKGGQNLKSTIEALFDYALPNMTPKLLKTLLGNTRNVGMAVYLDRVDVNDINWGPLFDLLCANGENLKEVHDAFGGKLKLAPVEKLIDALDVGRTSEQFARNAIMRILLAREDVQQWFTFEVAMAMANARKSDVGQGNVTKVEQDLLDAIISYIPRANDALALANHPRISRLGAKYLIQNHPSYPFAAFRSMLEAEDKPEV
ncbi:MAG: hypothetical protein WC873_01570 [Candidatus Gracilibacteria bacterium]